MKTRPGGIWGAINQASYGQGYSGLTRWIPARIKWQKKLRTTSHQRNSAAHCIIETQTESDCTKKLQKRSGTLLSEHINFILGFFFLRNEKLKSFPKKGGDSPQLVPPATPPTNNGNSPPKIHRRKLFSEDHPMPPGSFRQSPLPPFCASMVRTWTIWMCVRMAYKPQKCNGHVGKMVIDHQTCGVSYFQT